MNYLTLPIATPEFMKENGLQPFAGVRLFDLVGANPTEKAKLLSPLPRIAENKYGKKVVFVVEFLGKQFLVKLRTVVELSSLKEGQEFTLEQRVSEDGTIKWVEAV